MAQHNLSTVVGFEFTRTVRKRGFWIATLAVPVVIAIIFALSFVSGTSMSDSEDAQAETEIAFAYTDASGTIPEELAAAYGEQPVTDSTAAIEAVKTGELDAYFAYPPDPAAEPIGVSGADRGLFDNGAYEAVAQSLLITSAQAQVGGPGLAAAAAGDLEMESTIYRDGEVTGGFTEAIVPLGLLVVFLLVIVLLSNQMLSSTLEEKENRVTEMILTTVNPTTLVLGKILALLAVGLVQILVLLAPVVAGYVFFRDRLNIPDLDLSSLPLDAGTMIVQLLLLVAGFVLFTGVLVAIGAIMPTAKDAGVIFGPLIFSMFIPFYAVSLIISDPGAMIVAVFTFFPLTAPVTAMLRNGFGTLDPLTGGIVLAELFILGVLVLKVAVGLFRYGSIAYTNKLNPRAVLGAPAPSHDEELASTGPPPGGRTGKTSGPWRAARARDLSSFCHPWSGRLSRRSRCSTSPHRPGGRASRQRWRTRKHKPPVSSSTCSGITATVSSSWERLAPGRSADSTGRRNTRRLAEADAVASFGSKDD